MNDLKICVYAICKNEEKFVDRWISSLINEADYIVVLDTGSTDNTVKELKKYSPKVRVEQKIITPWRFDTARNESMKLIPRDADICCVADLDQIWRPGWGEAIRKCFREGITEPCGDIINYAEDGSEEGRITSRNVHPNDPDYWWERPIHEGLYYHGTKNQPKGFSKDFVIEHRQDKSKSRGGYLGLLETWYKEEIAKLPEIPLDPYCAIYYGCELGFHGRNEESLQVFLDSLHQCDFSKNPEILYQTYLNISAYYEEKNDLFKALGYAKLAKNETGISTRKVYCKIGELLNKLKMPDESIEYYEKALTIHPAYIGWEEDRRLYEPGVIEFDLSIICYYNKDYEKAYKYGQIAYSQLQTKIAYDNLQFYVNALNNDRKVCVYTICKNEEYNVEKWFDCVKTANCVVVLDTGSTDNTWNILEKLSSQNNNLHIYKKEYDDLNFGEMRNDSLKLAKNLIDESNKWIMVNLDLDEFLEEKGIELIRVRWKEEYDCMRLSGITPGQSSQVVFRKIHSSSPSWYWKRRVHETIFRDDKKKKDWVIGDSNISYTHVQNTTIKNRNYYELLKKENQERPNDELTLIYLAWEAFLHNENEEALRYSKECLDLFENNKVDFEDDFPWEKEAIKMQALFNLIPHSSGIEKKELIDKCISDIEKGLFYNCRRIYMTAANIYWDLNKKEKCIEFYLKALNTREEPSIWFNTSYEDKDIMTKLGIAFYYTGDIASAISYGLLAKDMVNVNVYYRPKFKEIFGKDCDLISKEIEGNYEK